LDYGIPAFVRGVVTGFRNAPKLEPR
jgi:hypothetical protein